MYSLLMYQLRHMEHLYDIHHLLFHNQYHSCPKQEKFKGLKSEPPFGEILVDEKKKHLRETR